MLMRKSPKIETSTQTLTHLLHVRVREVFFERTTLLSILARLLSEPHAFDAFTLTFPTRLYSLSFMPEGDKYVRVLSSFLTRVLFLLYFFPPVQKGVEKSTEASNFLPRRSLRACLW